MRDDDILIGTLMEESWLTIEQMAAACRTEPEWLIRHLDEGLFPAAESVAGVWRFSGTCLLRARRMHALEKDFGRYTAQIRTISGVYNKETGSSASVDEAKELVKRFEELGITPMKLNGEAFAGFVGKQVNDWAPAIKAAPPWGSMGQI